MRRRIASWLLACLPSLPGVGAVPPAAADVLDWFCDTRAVQDPTDPWGRTWFELTTSSFVGTPDVTQWEVTCWLQTSPDLLTSVDWENADPTQPSTWTGPQPNLEIANTRHTCAGTVPAGQCVNPVAFQVEPSDDVYACAHVIWTDTQPLTSLNDPAVHEVWFDAEPGTAGVQCFLLSPA